jgi:preprotein translocase subunit SecE
MQPILNYFKESRAELAKVNWPNRRQATKLTLIVVAFALVLAAFIGVIDFVFGRGLQFLIRKA